MKHWSRRGAVAWLLWPASLLFGIVVLVRRLFFKIHLFKSHNAGIPVIAIGNLTAGGSGKTPLVLRIAELLQERKWRPGIVARGFHHPDHRLVGGDGVGADDHDRFAQAGASPAQLARELLDARELDRQLVDHVLALRVYQHAHLARALELLLCVGGGQIDLQLGVLRVGGGDHEKDQDHHHHVDQGDQVDLGLLLVAAALEVHRRAYCLEAW